MQLRAYEAVFSSGDEAPDRHRVVLAETLSEAAAAAQDNQGDLVQVSLMDEQPVIVTVALAGMVGMAEGDEDGRSNPGWLTLGDVARVDPGLRGRPARPDSDFGPTAGGAASVGD